MNKFIFGVGKVDITPPLNIPYLGFSPRHSFFEGIHDPLYVRSLYISDGREEGIIISANLIGFSNSLFGKGRNFTEEVRRKIEDLTGIKKGNIMLSASHIHSTPDTIDIRPLRNHPGAIEWLEVLKEKIVTSAILARNNTFKGKLKIGKGQVKNISHNRRGERYLDEELILLLFESEREEKVFVVNFSCHPVIVQAQSLVSADFVGVLENKVEEIIEKTQGCLFLQGACGDINPVKNDTRDFRDVYYTGMALAGEVIKIFGKIKLSKSQSQPVILRFSSKKVHFPSRPLPDKREIEKIKKEKGDRYVEEVLERVKEGKGPFEGEIQVIRLGDAIIVGIPGEPFSLLGKEIKEKSKPFVGIPVGYTNGYLGYIAPPESWEKGGYEVSCGPWSKIGKKSYNIILQTFENLIGKEKRQKSGK